MSHGLSAENQNTVVVKCEQTFCLLTEQVFYFIWQTISLDFMTISKISIGKAAIGFLHYFKFNTNLFEFFINNTNLTFLAF